MLYNRRSERLENGIKEGDISKAAEFANYAAAISVSKKGTSFPRIGDLKNFFNKKSIDDKMEFDH